MVLANLLKRGAILRYKRLAGLSSVEFGLGGPRWGRRPPMSVISLAEAVGMDKGTDQPGVGRNWSRASWSPRRPTQGITAKCWFA